MTVAIKMTPENSTVIRFVLNLDYKQVKAMYEDTSPTDYAVIDISTVVPGLRKVVVYTDEEFHAEYKAYRHELDKDVFDVDKIA